MAIRIYEVGPRDGLQNESIVIPTETKAQFVSALVAAGLKEIEVTSFVSPKWVPQLGDATEVWSQLKPGAHYVALVPNLQGLERAKAAGVRRIALFTAASESFCQKNLNSSIRESLDRYQEVIAAAQGQWIRAYVSTAFHCPFEGKIPPDKTRAVIDELLEMGVDEVSVGDTVGRAAPTEVTALAIGLPTEKVAWHFHDTYGTAIANVQAALNLGFTAFDSSAGGLGGCPYAPGATGNVATEDLIYLLERQGVATGVDLAALSQASLEVLARLGKAPSAKAQVATLHSL